MIHNEYYIYEFGKSFKLADKLNLKRSDIYVALWNLRIYYT